MRKKGGIISPIYPVQYRSKVDSDDYYNAEQKIENWFEKNGIMSSHRSSYFVGEDFLDCWDLYSPEDQILFMLKWGG